EFEVEFAQATEEEAKHLIRAFVRAFDLEKAPLLRVGLIELGINRHLLLFDIHHIVSDGASSSILIHEFVQLYKGEELPALRIQYKDYAVWQQEEVQSQQMNKQEEYWLDVFHGEIPVLDMPTDFVRPAIQTYQGDTFDFFIDKE